MCSQLPDMDTILIPLSSSDLTLSADVSSTAVVLPAVAPLASTVEVHLWSSHFLLWRLLSPFPFHQTILGVGTSLSWDIFASSALWFSPNLFSHFITPPVVMVAFSGHG